MIRIVLLLSLLSVPVMAANILVIESYHAEFGWDAGYRKGLIESLTPEHELTFFEMDTKRIPSREYENRAELAHQAYLQLKPDLVVVGDDNALSYMLPKLYQEPIPIVFLGINSNPRELLTQYSGKAGVTGVLERPFFTKTMAGIGEVFDSPNTKPKVLIMFDSGNTSKIAVRTIENQVPLIKQNLGIEAHVITLSTERAWHDAVMNAPRNGVSAIVVGLFQTLINSNGESVSSEALLDWTSKNSSVPLFGFWDFSIGKGKAAGGVILDGRSQGKQAGNIAREILEKGLDASTVPIQAGHQGMDVYSPEEFKRLGLTPPNGWKAVEW
ncbi:ABC transporter substrate-binding protein [Vibrio ziniensis]|uniref:Sugar ABC transporter ATPase n=1 Tax=Vibrio ziniensis TaxID=2711221 RepID=A0A6G7CN85_9VIBR|nr:ABC transporter substrate binding protein [Vibrio ziniensis]QIH43530.1 hypothetical protein G5S32_16165 [Vibrio ziniensis]